MKERKLRRKKGKLSKEDLEDIKICESRRKEESIPVENCKSYFDDVLLIDEWD